MWETYIAEMIKFYQKYMMSFLTSWVSSHIQALCGSSCCILKSHVPANQNGSIVIDKQIHIPYFLLSHPIIRSQHSIVNTITHNLYATPAVSDLKKGSSISTNTSHIYINPPNWIPFLSSSFYTSWYLLFSLSLAPFLIRYTTLRHNEHLWS